MNLRCNKCHHGWEEDPTAGMGVVQCPECYAVVPMVLAKAVTAPAGGSDDTVSDHAPTVTQTPLAQRPERPKPKISIVSEEPPPLYSKPASSASKPRFADSQKSGADISDSPTEILSSKPSQPVSPFDLTTPTPVSEDVFDTEVSRTQPAQPATAKRDFSKSLPKELDLTGETIGGYQVKSMLGAGGMGAVCLARQLSLDRDVALKILPGGLASNPEFLSRFTREALSAAQLSHHNIIQVHDVGSDKSIHYISMEFVRGDNLGVLVRKDGKMSVDDAAAYVLQAARGLKYAHERGIIHRDIKPDNIMLNEHGIVKIADMGLAKMRHEAEASAPFNPNDAMLNKARGDLTMVGGAMGTPAYMPPEQARDASSVDHRADQYSLGCTLYYLCAGKAPYSGSTAFEIISKHQTDPVPPLEAHVRQVPPALSKIIHRMMAKEPADRYPDLNDVIKDLENYLGVEAQHGAYTPREQHLMVLENAQRDYYSASRGKVRKLAPLAFLGACIALVTISIFAGKVILAGGFIGLMVMTPLANFVLDGILHKTYLFRRVRSVFFGMTWSGWLGTFAAAAVAGGALFVLGLLPFWLMFAVLSAGLAVAYQWAVIKPLNLERASALSSMQDALKQLRVRGVSEENLHNFVCRFSGENWEEFFEELFGYEAMVFARGRWAAADKVKSRKKYATWREPIARWLEGVEEHRKNAREKKQLQKVEVQRLQAQGVSTKEAEQQAEEAATKILGDIKIASQVAGDAKPKRTHSPYQQTMPGLIFRTVRLVAGIGILVYFAAYFLRNLMPASLAQYASLLDRLPLPESIMRVMNSFPGALAGAGLLLSAFSTRLIPVLMMTLGAVFIVAADYLMPLASGFVPVLTSVTYFYGAAGLIAAGAVTAFLAKASTGRF